MRRGVKGASTSLRVGSRHCLLTVAQFGARRHWSQTQNAVNAAFWRRDTAERRVKHSVRRLVLAIARGEDGIASRGQAGQLAEQDAEGVHVGAHVELLAARLLRRHAVEQQLAGGGLPVVVVEGTATPYLPFPRAVVAPMVRPSWTGAVRVQLSPPSVVRQRPESSPPEDMKCGPRFASQIEA